MHYGYQQQLKLSFTEALVKAEIMLHKEGFDVMYRIDVKEIMNNKLHTEFSNYYIFGACNASVAYWALKEEKQIGLLLPCNLVVYEEGKQVFAAVVLPKVLLGLSGNQRLLELANKVDKRLKKVIDRLFQG